MEYLLCGQTYLYNGFQQRCVFKERAGLSSGFTKHTQFEGVLISDNSQLMVARTHFQPSTVHD